SARVAGDFVLCIRITSTLEDHEYFLRARKNYPRWIRRRVDLRTRWRRSIARGLSRSPCDPFRISPPHRQCNRRLLASYATDQGIASGRRCPDTPPVYSSHPSRLSPNRRRTRPSPPPAISRRVATARRNASGY